MAKDTPVKQRWEGMKQPARYEVGILYETYEGLNVCAPAGDSLFCIVCNLVHSDASCQALLTSERYLSSSAACSWDDEPGVLGADITHLPRPASQVVQQSVKPGSSARRYNLISPFNRE